MELLAAVPWFHFAQSQSVYISIQYTYSIYIVYLVCGVYFKILQLDKSDIV